MTQPRTVIYRVQSPTNPNHYIPMTYDQISNIAVPLWLEGVDGDEDTNTVTYWYTLEEPA